VVNSQFAVFSRSGALLAGPFALLKLFSGFAGRCAERERGDPMVVYDALADRWVITFQSWNDSDTDGRQCFAVSKTPDPAADWYRYEFAFELRNDYAKLAVWPTAYIYTTDLLHGPASLACALDRARMLAGADASQQCFAVASFQPFPADLDGHLPPPPGAAAYFVSNPLATGSFELYRLAVNWDQPQASTFSTVATLPSASWTQPCGACVDQPGTAQQLETATGFLMNRVTYRNFGDHESLLVTRSAAVGPVTGIRWSEIRVDGSAPRIQQEGTFVPDGLHRWMGSAAMDGAGNIALAYSVSSASVYPSIRFTGRLAGDPPGLLTFAEQSLYEGTVSQTSGYRWGDYSSLQVDPLDDCTFWFSGEYAGPGTRIGAFRIPGCAAANTFVVDVLPHEQNVAPGASATFRIQTSVTSGNADPVRFRVSGAPAAWKQVLASTTVQAGEATVLTVTPDAAAQTGSSGVFLIEATSASARWSNFGRLWISPPHGPKVLSGSSCATIPAPELALPILAAALLLRRIRRRAVVLRSRFSARR
jgi:hypothetical protein